MADNIFNFLNSSQKEAVVYNEGPSIILAGAGSGKTRVLVYKVIYLINYLKINPLSIVMVTFTNKAGEEMKKRITKLAKINNLGFIGTFHSFSASVLRRFADRVGFDNNFLIYDEEDQLSLIKEIIRDVHPQKKYSPSYFLNRISEAKNHLIPPEEYLGYFSSFYNCEIIDRVYREYQKRLKKNQAMDFDDLLMNTVFLFRKDKKILEFYQQKYRYFFY